VQVDCCSNNTYTLSPGDDFEFVNYTSGEIQITGCNPPLPVMAYTVPAAQNGTPGVCPAQIADGVADGDYPLATSGCPAPPPHNPTIKIAT
jgi:hypothetical protein